MTRHLLTLLWLLSPAASALTIDLRYDLDTTGFFNQPGAKEALRTAADFYEELIVDQLGAIDRTQYGNGTWTPTYSHPVTGAQTAVPGHANMLVPANTLIIFAGAAALPAGMAANAGPGGVSGLSPEASGSGFPWANRVYNRGEPGAIKLVQSGASLTFTSNPVDFAPWGGAMFFNSSMANWNFSTTSATGTSGPDALSVALHEIAHILGVGIWLPQCSWKTLTPAGPFLGILASQSYGTLPLTDYAHLFPGTNSRALGVFGRTHGTLTTSLMVANLQHSNNFYVPTDVDLAILHDIGWEIETPSPMVLVSMNPGPQLRIPSTTGYTYQIQRSTTLTSWIDQLATPAPGTGARLVWSDPQAAGTAFYRVARQKTAVSAMAASHGISGAAIVPAAGGEAMIPPDLPPACCTCGQH